MPFLLDPVALFDGGFGPYLVPVAPPDAIIAPGSKLNPKDRGKVPAILTSRGWSLISDWPLYNCPDYQTAVLWRDGWGANAGLICGAGSGVLDWDNDIGEEATEVLHAALRAEGVNPLRRIVLDDRHKRDGFVVRVVDFVGEPDPVQSRNLTFKRGIEKSQIQILSTGRQFVVHGVHPGTRAPYAWDREIKTLADIPEIGQDGVQRIVRSLVDRLQGKSWSPGAALASTAPAALLGAPVAIGDHTPEEQAEADVLLAILVNRDVPPGQPRTAIDEHFDDYGAYIVIAYAIFVVWGDAGRSRWIAWASGRFQAGQDPETVWESVRRQTHPRARGLPTLWSLVRLLAPGDFERLRREFAHKRFDAVPVDPEIEGGDDPPEPPASSQTPEWDEVRAKWAFVYEQDKYVNRETRGLIVRSAFNEHLKLQAIRIDAELFGPHTGRPRSMSAILALRPDIVQFRNVIYSPGDPQIVNDPEIQGEIDFNRWRPARHGIVSGVSEAQIGKWLDHVGYVLGPHKTLFIEWCAAVAQKPGMKPNWHFLIIGTQGLGKDILALPMRFAVGAANCYEMTTLDVGATQFNGFLEHKLIVIGETKKVGKNHDVSTQLKPILASPPLFHTINQKNLKPYNIPNRTAVMMFSNEENPLYLETKQRRVYVVDRQGLAVKPRAHYDDLWNWLEKQGGAQLVASYLLEYALPADIDARMRGMAPATSDTVEHEQANRNPLHVAVDEFIEDARAGKSPLVVQAADIVSSVSHLFPRRPPTARDVGAYLRQLEKRGAGVFRAKPKLDDKGMDTGAADVVGTNKKGGRLWLLDDTLRALGPPQWVAIWQGDKVPPSATVTPFRRRDFPDDDDESLII